MFKIHEVVMHNTLGICEIQGIERRSIVGRPASEYYILHSLYDEDNTACVPVEGCERLMRFPMRIASLQNCAAAAAKSLQSCPTLCDPRDGSPPGPTIPGILQARMLEWVAISSSSA